MFNKKLQVRCPVGQHTDLGYRTVGMAFSAACQECGYVFKIDENGKWMKPVKIIERKVVYCGCGRCSR